MRILLIGLVFGATAFASGCATVAPYERGTLARSDMQLESSSELVDSERHVTELREGAKGGYGAGGGGCGCN